jgi:hypothetical protein
MGEQRRRQRRSALIVQVRYEPSRVGAACLADAYEQVLPAVQRRLSGHDQRADPEPTPIDRQEGVAG